MSVDLRKIKKLIELVEASGISELEVRDGEETIRIARPFGGLATRPAGSMPARSAMGAGAEAAEGVPVDDRPSSQPARRTSIMEIRSPMAGTFYRAPGPGQRPFVEPGQKVEAGDVVCIIESMKMMNEITADRPGTCVAVVGHDGEAVSTGQVLLRFES